MENLIYKNSHFCKIHIEYNTTVLTKLCMWEGLGLGDWGL